MGATKQLLPLGDSTLLERTLQNVRNAELEEVILILGSSADFICEQLSESLAEDLSVVTNPDYEEGMASSLRAGIGAVSPGADGALIVLADQPFVRPETLKRIVEEYCRTHAEIVIPMHDGRRGNPVLLDRSVFEEVMALEGDVGCRAIFDSHQDGIVKVEVKDPGILLDIDNPEDYERLRNSEA
jgi:molybdenum cofactor cytidylyltransferase